MACDLEVLDEVNPFFPKLLLFMVFIPAIESKLEQPSFLLAVVTGKQTRTAFLSLCCCLWKKVFVCSTYSPSSPWSPSHHNQYSLLHCSEFLRIPYVEDTQ